MELPNQEEPFKLFHGDCFEVLKTLKSNSIHSIVTDPPYGISFMNKRWDYDVPSVEVWKELFRVLRPGGHILVACGTRTQHRMAVNIEDGGFEICDVITWLYGSGFPKSLDVSKAIDKQAGVEREVVGKNQNHRELLGTTTHGDSFQPHSGDGNVTVPKTQLAKQWEGWGTALKPACEFWTLACKPMSEGTIADNVFRWGVGGINIDESRVEYADEKDAKEGRSERATTSKGQFATQTKDDKFKRNDRSAINGRFPANLLLDEEAAVLLDEQTGTLNPSRFFYVSKASKSERDYGLDGFKEFTGAERTNRKEGSAGITAVAGAMGSAKNFHPTVKPIKLMRYLCKLITPKNGIVLDPFMGSGSTGVAARKENFQFIGIEREKEYKEISQKRIEAVKV